MKNPYIDAVTEQIHIGGLRIANHTDVIFFCGGPRNDDDSGTPYSARDFILRNLFVSKPDIYGRLYYEESMLEWFRDGHYVDLLSFERHISEISSVVFLIAESPGSFAELGAFASQPSIVDKLFVVISGENDNDDTFLALGPIKLLREADETKVRTYEWRAEFHTGQPPKVNSDDLEEIWEHIINGLVEYEIESVKESKFAPESEGNVSLLLLDLLNMFGALTHNELLGMLAGLIESFDRKQLKKHLFLLEKVELISVKQYGVRYYLSNSDTTHIHYDFTEGTDRSISDRSRLTMRARKWFEENDPTRFKVIRKHAKGWVGE